MLSACFRSLNWDVRTNAPYSKCVECATNNARAPCPWLFSVLSILMNIIQDRGSSMPGHRDTLVAV